LGLMHFLLKGSSANCTVNDVFITSQLMCMLTMSVAIVPIEKRPL